MYIFHCVLINTLSAHIIHTNLDMIFYTHVEHSPIKNNLHKVTHTHTHTHTHSITHSHTQTHTHPAINLNIWMCMTLIWQWSVSYIIHVRAHAHTHTDYDCSRNWILILVGAKILWEEEGFQFSFKRWQGWTVSKVLWDWIPNVGSKTREGAKAVSLAFPLVLDTFLLGNMHDCPSHLVLRVFHFVSHSTIHGQHHKVSCYIREYNY